MCKCPSNFIAGLAKKWVRGCVIFLLATRVNKEAGFCDQGVVRSPKPWLPLADAGGKFIQPSPVFFSASIEIGCPISYQPQIIAFVDLKSFG